MHTVLPHEHHSELDEVEHVEQHETATGFLDFIKLAFHMDQGEGHLEKYQPSGASFLFTAILAEELTLEFQPVLFYQSDFTSSIEEEILQSRFLSSQLRFRGPPNQA